jgi:hypothetical protein
MIIKSSEAQELIKLCDYVVDMLAAYGVEPTHYVVISYVQACVEMLEGYGVEPDLKLMASYIQACDARQPQSSVLGLFLCSSVTGYVPERGQCKMQWRNVNSQKEMDTQKKARSVKLTDYRHNPDDIKYIDLEEEFPELNLEEAELAESLKTLVRELAEDDQEAAEHPF